MKLNNKIIATVFASVIGVGILSGCDEFAEGYAEGSGTGPRTVTPAPNVLPADVATQTPAPTPERPSMGTPPSDPDEKFIWLIDHSNQITDGEVSVDYPKQATPELISFGKAVCSDLSKGIYDSGAELAFEVWSSDPEFFSIQEMNYIVIAAMQTYCPWED